MKKFISMICALVLLFSLAAGCAGGETTGVEVGDGDVGVDPDAGGVADADPGDGDPDGGEPDIVEDPDIVEGPDADDEPDLCDSELDCEGGELCVRQAPGEEGVCEEPGEERGDGESCSSSQQCESGLCHDQTCTRECTDALDCEEGWICRDQGGVGVCEEPVACTSDDDCEVAGDLCTVDREDGVRVICQPPVGGGELGDQCTEDGDCEAGLCLDSSCSNPCESPADCGGGEDFICTSEDLGGENVNVCTERPAEACLSDLECDGTDRCVALVSDDDFFFACGAPNDGGGSGGASCGGDGDCLHNLCVDGSCAEPCDDDSICSDITASKCGSNSVEREGVEATLSTCSVPELCDNPGACSASETCYVVAGDTSVDTICESPNLSNRATGEFCSSNSQCGSNYCHTGRFATYCATPCSVNVDCPATVEGFAMECGTTDIAHESGTDAVDVCLHSTPDSCTVNGNCEAGESCAFVVDELESGLETLCLPTAGGVAPGGFCTSDAQCGSRYCLDNSCSAPCTDRDMCGDFQFCEENTVDKSGQQDVFEICRDVPFQSCMSTSDCDPSGVLACNRVVRDADGAVEDLVCWLSNDGGDPLGTSCTASASCESDFCWPSEDQSTGECTVFCQDGAVDCGDGQVCGELGGDIRGCFGECERNADCDGGNICSLGINKAGTAVQKYCLGTLGDGATGEPCVGAEDCQTGLCLTITSESGEESVCSESCDPVNGHGDCQDGHDLVACSEDVTLTWDGGANSEQVSACSYGLE